MCSHDSTNRQDSSVQVSHKQYLQTKECNNISLLKGSSSFQFFTEIHIKDSQPA